MVRRVVAKVEFHCGELFPRVGFIVTIYGPLPRCEAVDAIRFSDDPVATIYSASLEWGCTLLLLPRALMEIRALSPYQSCGLEGLGHG